MSALHEIGAAVAPSRGILTPAVLDAVAALCRQYDVARLDVFGSANTSRFDPRRSDIDLLVEFDPSSEQGAAERFFGLHRALEDLLGRKVDLLNESALRNPHLIGSINRNRRQLYRKL